MKPALPFSVCRLVTILVVSLFGAQSSFSQSANGDNTSMSLDQLQTRIHEIIDSSDTPAAGITLVQGDSVIWSGGIGLADKENNIKADQNTMFRIGSTSKMFASLSILKLVEEGKVNLKDKVSDLIPEIEFTNQWAETNPILVEHLLEHTTGWDDIHLTEYGHNDPTPASLKDGLDFHPHSRISRWVPGTRMSYCNAGPPVAAYIVQKLTGMDFEDYVHVTFLDPMGMDNMTYRKSTVYDRTGAKLYQQGNEQPYWHILVRPSGSINASPVDMSKMIRFYNNRGKGDSTQIISESSLRRMETSETTLGAQLGTEVGYGLSNYTTPYGGYMFHGHNGGVNGGLNDLAYAPDLAIGYNVSINSGQGAILNSIVKLVRDYLLGSNKKEINLLPDYKPDGSINGYYKQVNPRNQMFYFTEELVNIEKISANGDTTIRHSIFGGEQTKYYAVNNDQFRSAKTGLISLLKVNDPLTGDGIQINWNAYQKISAFQAWMPIVVGGLWLLFVSVGFILGIVWVIMAAMNKIQGKINVWARFFPILANISLLAGGIGLAMGAGDPFVTLSSPTFISVFVMVATIGFALLSVYALYYLISNRNNGIDTFAYWFSLITCVLDVIAVVYLFGHGVIGLQTWA